jgi:hypothetical protein
MSQKLMSRKKRKFDSSPNMGYYLLKTSSHDDIILYLSEKTAQRIQGKCRVRLRRIGKYYGRRK